MLLSAIILLGCDREPSPPHRQYIGALQQIQDKPEEADSACGPIRDSVLRADCYLAAVERAGESGRELCERLEGKSRGECHFILAEKGQSLKDCEEAGPYARDCRLHLLSRSLARENEYTVQAAESLLAGHGLEGSQEGWTAVYRNFHSKKRPLDLGWCRDSPDPLLCRKAGLQIFRDRLNRARDTDKVECSGEVQPPMLGFHPDKILQEELASFLRGACSP
jgi:hypothetical protein